MNERTEALGKLQIEQDTTWWLLHCERVSLYTQLLARGELARCPEELRGWEWHYLFRQANNRAFSIEGETFRQVRWSKDGRRLLTVSTIPKEDEPWNRLEVFRVRDAATGPLFALSSWTAMRTAFLGETSS